MLHCYFHLDFINNILLAPVSDSNIAQLQRYFLVHQHSSGVGSFVHYINFSDDSYCPFAIRIQLPGHEQSIASTHILIGRDYTENNGPFIPSITHTHILSDPLYVMTLVIYSYFGDTRQINDGQVRTGRTIDCYDDRLVDYLLLPSCFLVSKHLYLVPHHVEIFELLIGQFFELGIWLIDLPFNHWSVD